MERYGLDFVLQFVTPRAVGLSSELNFDRQRAPADAANPRGTPQPALRRLAVVHLPEQLIKHVLRRPAAHPETEDPCRTNSGTIRHELEIGDDRVLQKCPIRPPKHFHRQIGRVLRKAKNNPLQRPFQ